MWAFFVIDNGKPWGFPPLWHPLVSSISLHPRLFQVTRRTVSGGALATEPQWHTSRTRVSMCFSPLFPTHSAGVPGFLNNFPGIFEIRGLPLDFFEIGRSYIHIYIYIYIAVRLQNFWFFLVFFARNRCFRVHRPRRGNNKSSPMSGKKFEISSDLGKIGPKCPKKKSPGKMS